MYRLLAPIGIALFLGACSPQPGREAANATANSAAHDPAGDPVKTLPGNYKLELENDYARVLRVHYNAGAKLPEHIHPAGSTAYIYLNDNDAVLFTHAGATERPDERPLQRPPVKAGGARFATSHEEHHTVENVSSTPSDFIRVFFKTDNAGLPDNVRRRIPLSEQEFSNAQARVSRPPFEAGKPLVVPASDHPSLLVAWPSGKLHWVEAKSSAPIAADAENTLGFVRIEFLTAPLK